MRRVRSWGSAPRIVLVIALALGLAVLGRYLVSLGHRTQFGWYAYAPLNGSLHAPIAAGMRPWVRALIWLGLIGVWAAASVWMLRPPRGAVSDRRRESS